MGKVDDLVISVDNVTKKFGSFTALDSISLEVRKGQIHGFLGPNGAGKTTTIKLLMDFIRPDSGTIEIFSRSNRTDAIKIRHEVGYLSGDMELYDTLTGDQYLRYIANLRGVGEYQHLKKFIHELEAVLDRKIGMLSRGNKQKIGLIAALIGDPDLLILDEPTTGLDPLMQQKFYAVLKEHARRGKTVFMSSHILSEVQEVCDTVTFMKQGKIVETVDVRALLSGAKRRVTLKLQKQATILDPPAQLKVSQIKRTKNTLSFDVEKADRVVMRWIASQLVDDVTITESSLDAVFMDMYEQEEE
jgi:ABC-2 type transport system ATP-binding protein